METKIPGKPGPVKESPAGNWKVKKGQKAWMWIMANEDTTVYVAAESRGKGIAEDMYGNSQAKCMTDGFGSYTNSIPHDKHCFCIDYLLLPPKRNHSKISRED